MSSAFDTGAGKQLSQLPSAARYSRFSNKSMPRWTGPSKGLKWCSRGRFWTRSCA